jgi:hypothetical protein
VRNPIYLFFTETSENPHSRSSRKASDKDRHYHCRHTVPNETGGRIVTISALSKGSTNGKVLYVDLNRFKPLLTVLKALCPTYAFTFRNYLGFTNR